jgi:hypothetical protein
MIRTVTEVSKIPDSTIFVVVNESMRYDDGYGSLSAPSYSNLNYLVFQYADTEDELKKHILDLTKSNKSFVVLSARKLNTKINISIDLE